MTAVLCKGSAKSKPVPWLEAAVSGGAWPTEAGQRITTVRSSYGFATVGRHSVCTHITRGALSTWERAKKVKF